MANLAVVIFLLGIIGIVVSIVLFVKKKKQKVEGKAPLFALIASLALIIASLILMPSPEKQGNGSQVEEATQTETAQVEKSEEDATQTETPQNEDEASFVRDESLNGRGMADVSRDEPNYVNTLGYVVVSATEELDLERTDDFQNLDNWTIPTYEKDKQFWNETDTVLPHKTEIVVKEQYLEHEGYGSYSGYLLVETTQDNEEYYIDVKNYITKPYWTYDDLTKASKEGPLVAEFHQVSDYYPVSSGGDKVELDDGAIVLITGITGGARGVNSDENGIEAVVWKEWKNGYGGVDVYFNEADLTIIF